MKKLTVLTAATIVLSLCAYNSLRGMQNKTPASLEGLSLTFEKTIKETEELKSKYLSVAWPSYTNNFSNTTNTISPVYLDAGGNVNAAPVNLGGGNYLNAQGQITTAPVFLGAMKTMSGIYTSKKIPQPKIAL